MRIGRVRLTLIGGLVLLLAVVAILWFVLLSPRLSKAAELNSQAAQLQTANLQLRNQYNKALDLAAQAPQAAADAQALFARMPRQAELPEVLDQITAAATAAGIKPQNVQTVNASIPNPVSAAGTDPTGINLAQLELSVTALGKRDQSLGFLDNLQALDRALLVTSTQVTDAATADAQPGKGADETVQVTGSMFVLQSPLPDLVATVEDLLAQAGQPTAAP
jgi:Tfp pilus assembly protein PilO